MGDLRLRYRLLGSLCLPSPVAFRRLSKLGTLTLGLLLASGCGALKGGDDGGSSDAPGQSTEGAGARIPNDWNGLEDYTNSTWGFQ